MTKDTVVLGCSRVKGTSKGDALESVLSKERRHVSFS